MTVNFNYNFNLIIIFGPFDAIAYKFHMLNLISPRLIYVAYVCSFRYIGSRSRLRN